MIWEAIVILFTRKASRSLTPEYPQDWELQKNKSYIFKEGHRIGNCQVVEDSASSWAPLTSSIPTDWQPPQSLSITSSKESTAHRKSVVRSCVTVFSVSRCHMQSVCEPKPVPLPQQQLIWPLLQTAATLCIFNIRPLLMKLFSLRNDSSVKANREHVQFIFSLGIKYSLYKKASLSLLIEGKKKDRRDRNYAVFTDCNLNLILKSNVKMINMFVMR